MQEMDEEVSLGRMLREARESRGMSIEDVADQLHVSSATINMIEQDECDLEATDAAFTRGYIRSYARLVELSEDEIGDLFGELSLVSSRKKPRLKRKIKIKEISSKDKPVRLITNFVIIILIILVLIWWYSHYVANTNNEAQPSVISATSPETTLNTDVQTQATPVSKKTVNGWTNPDAAKNE